MALLIEASVPLGISRAFCMIVTQTFLVLVLEVGENVASFAPARVNHVADSSQTPKNLFARGHSTSFHLQDIN